MGPRKNRGSDSLASRGVSSTPTAQGQHHTQWSGQTRRQKVCRGLEIQSQVTSTPSPTGTAQQAQEGSAHLQHSSLAAGMERPSLDSGTWHQPDLSSSQAAPAQFHLQRLWLPVAWLGPVLRPDAQTGSPPHSPGGCPPRPQPLLLYVHQPSERALRKSWHQPHSPLTDDDNDGPQEEDEDSKSPCTDAQDESHLLRSLGHLQGSLAFLAGSWGE